MYVVPTLPNSLFVYHPRLWVCRFVLGAVVSPPLPPGVPLLFVMHITYLRQQNIRPGQQQEWFPSLENTTGGGVCAALVPQHLARDVRIRHLHLANNHRVQLAGLLRVRVVAREAGAIVSPQTYFVVLPPMIQPCRAHHTCRLG